MRIQRNAFDSYDQASDAADAFPRCGHCGGPVKIHQIDGAWLVLCQRHPRGHRSLATVSRARAAETQARQ